MIVNHKKVITLHKHQKEGVNYIVSNVIKHNHKAFLLSDETGLGKTYTAITSVIRLYQYYSLNQKVNDILVVCPLSVTDYWRDCFKDIDPTFTNFSVINYHKLKNLFKKVIVDNKEQFIPLKKHSIIIFDECHQLKSYTGKFYKLSSIISDQSLFTLFMSATPAQSPLEAAYLKPLLGFNNFYQWLHQKNFAIYKHRTKRHFAWSNNPLDLEIIQNDIYNSYKGLRRKASDIAGWPEQQIIPLPISLSEKDMKAYNKCFQEYLNQRNANGKKPLSEDAQQMVKAAILRYTISQLKTSYTSNLVDELLKGNCKIAIFCEYIETMNLLYPLLKSYKPLILNGKTKNEDRSKIMNDFRYNSSNRLIISNIYQSINLEQPGPEYPPHIQINHDVSWSGIKAIQTNGRCHRNGMHCVIYNLFARNTIDESVVKIMTQRCINANSIAGDPLLNQPEMNFFESIINENY